MKATFIKLHWFLSSQFGLDPQNFMRSLRGVPAFLQDRAAFRQGYAGKMKRMPCLHDRYQRGIANVTNI